MKEGFEKQQKAFEYRIKKEKSVERTIWAHLQPRNSWEDGMNVEQVRTIVSKEKKKKYTKATIYNAIGAMCKYGSKWGIYIKSDYGWIDTPDGKKKEFRYFTPKISGDIRREFEKLENRKDNIDLREQSLDYYEKITIPQQIELERLRQKQNESPMS